MEVNLDIIPLRALRWHSWMVLVNGLDDRKAFSSDKGLPRDWRGLADLTEIGHYDQHPFMYPAVNVSSPTERLLRSWGRQPEATFGKLKEFLGRIDRWDIITDVDFYMREDAKLYLENQGGFLDAKPVDYSGRLFYDDVSRSSQELREFDALLLYADEDNKFAIQMVAYLKKHDLEVCLKDNILPGLAFEHAILLQIIKTRCRHVIIIISPNFKSPVDKFSISYAQSIAIENRQRIIIPCLYKTTNATEIIELPEDIRVLSKLDYSKDGRPGYNFWERLRDSVKRSPSERPFNDQYNTI